MVSRSQAAERTHRAIIQAAFDLYSERDFDQVSLDDVAAQAGVTVRTLLRRFGSKEALLDAVAEAADREVEGRRQEVPPGDAAAAVRCVVTDYEGYGDAIMRLLSQENRVAAFGRTAERGRRLHHEWVDRAFGPQLSRRSRAARRQLRAQLIAITDVYTWKLMRRDLGLGRSATVEALGEMVAGVTGEPAGSAG
ncbi:MAG TPA: helix-turn-helix domain-containing protein [Solirubrobacterales bacterium]|nr:helix-turn-helix domain-containing protein [Solirubrobacterales bacterium]